MSQLINRVLTKINWFSIQQLPNKKFQLLSDVPIALKEFFPTDQDQTITMIDSRPYLKNFLVSAEEFWKTNSDVHFRSGPWMETLSNGNQIALEAIALWVDGKKIILIEDLGDKFVTQSSQLQTARENLLNNEQLELELQKRTQSLIDREEQIALCLTTAATYRDQETGEHIRRIGLYSAIIAEQLGWSKIEVDRIRIAAPMHDIGKIGIPDSVLLKPARLSHSEYEIMKSHSIIGSKMLSNTGIDMMNMASDIALSHHERWDGSGYPYGLSSEKIPMSARITAVVDIYDAMVHKRVYKPAIPEKEVLSQMNRMSGSHLDPLVFNAFMDRLPEVQKIRHEHVDHPEYFAQQSIG